MGGPFGKYLNPHLIHYSGVSVGFRAYSGIELGWERWQGEGQRSVNKQKEADSTSIAVEYCEEILATIRELKGLDFCQRFLWVWVLSEQKLPITFLKALTNRTFLSSAYLK